MPREMPSKVASTASPAARLLILALFATASTRSPFVISVHLLPGESVFLVVFIGHELVMQKQRENISNSVENVNIFFQALVAHALITDDDLLGAKKRHDSFNQVSAREDHIGPFGLESGNGFPLRYGPLLKKPYLAPNLAQRESGAVNIAMGVTDYFFLHRSQGFKSSGDPHEGQIRQLVEPLIPQ